MNLILDFKINLNQLKPIRHIVVEINRHYLTFALAIIFQDSRDG